jgi:HK97 gp10 family phage protein
MIRVLGAAACETLAAALVLAVGDAVEAEAVAIRDEAKRRCPADEGTLRESIRAGINVTGDTVEAVIGSTLPYAAKVEFGTLTQTPRPFLAPAFKARREEIAGRIRRAVRAALEGNTL